MGRGRGMFDSGPIERRDEILIGQIHQIPLFVGRKLYIFPEIIGWLQSTRGIASTTTTTTTTRRRRWCILIITPFIFIKLTVLVSLTMTVGQLVDIFHRL